jgi:hypothetical protein
MMKALPDQGMAPVGGRKGRAPVDWESVERDYRAGMLSVREIARHAGVDEKAIRKRAKAKGWERDLTDKVRKQVRAALVRNEVRSEVRTEDDLRTEEEIVDAAAAQVVTLIREHRSDIRAQRATLDTLRQELDAAMTAGNLPLSARTAILKDLSAVLKNLIPLERQAFNLDNPEPPKVSPSVNVNIAVVPDRFRQQLEEIVGELD